MMFSKLTIISESCFYALRAVHRAPLLGYLLEFVMNKLALRLGAFGSLVLVSAASQAAALDITAATTGITDATTAVVAVLGAMITMGAAFFGLKKVKRLIGG